MESPVNSNLKWGSVWVGGSTCHSHLWASVIQTAVWQGPNHILPRIPMKEILSLDEEKAGHDICYFMTFRTCTDISQSPTHTLAVNHVKVHLSQVLQKYTGAGKIFLHPKANVGSRSLQLWSAFNTNYHFHCNSALFSCKTNYTPHHQRLLAPPSWQPCDFSNLAYSAFDMAT